LRHTILIVDDAEFMRVMLRDIVEDMGCQVVGESGHGKRAAPMYADLRPDLVLLDITMPDRDGTEALAEILAVDPAAMVVMISALGQKNQVLAAIKAGAQDFVVKPFDHERVRETLTRLLAAAPA
jgi:two-component system chemotaxis response regulator CheY